MTVDSPQSKGGRARAERLSDTNRRQIAQKAARARWDSIRQEKFGVVPKTIVTGVLGIGSIPCAVLDDSENSRVLTQAGFLSAIGRSRTPTGSQDRFAELPPFLRSKNLQPFISKELAASSQPIIFDFVTTDETGRKNVNRAWGYHAEVLPAVCWVYAKAQMAGALTERQKHIAEACTHLLEGLTNVAINALIDEATGYQYLRAKDALEQIIGKWLVKELQPWKKYFPVDYYKRIHELNGWDFDQNSTKRPQVVGHWTNDIVYDRLGPGLREQLHEYVGRDHKGRLKHHLTQFLTSNHGIPELKSHLDGVVALMRAASNWQQFKEMLQRAYPKPNTTLSMALDDLTQIQKK